MAQPVLVSDASVSPELSALREELGILHEIFGAMRGGNIRAEHWPKAKATLEYLDAKITAAQAKADAISPPEPVIPDLSEASH